MRDVDWPAHVARMLLLAFTALPLKGMPNLIRALLARPAFKWRAASDCRSCSGFMSHTGYGVLTLQRFAYATASRSVQGL